MVQELSDLLTNNSDRALNVLLPSGKFIPDHFHVTEIAKVEKTFIDCGGTHRQEIFCTLQAWVANDRDHRLKSDKLANILSLSLSFIATDLEVVVEYGTEAISQYFISHADVTEQGILLFLSAKRTDCLAPDKCGVNNCC